MAEIYIDPFLFAVPGIEKGETEFNNYINCLLEWKSLRDIDSSEIYTLRAAHEILLTTNRYPLWEDLKNVINAFNIDYIQPKDIVNLVDSFLTKISNIEDAINIIDYLFEDYTLSPLPNRDNGTFIEKLSDLLTLSKLKQTTQASNNYQFLLTKDIDSADISVTSKVLLLEFSSNKVLKTPLEIEHSVPCCISFDSFCKSFDIAELWIKTNSENVYKFLISIHAYKVSKNLGIDSPFESLKSFDFGSDFISSLNENNFLKNKDKATLAIRSFSETLLNISLASTHALRASQSPSSPQVEEDGFKAWRRDIDYEYHLHYWKNSKKVIFSRVVTHNDFKINF